MKLISYVNGIWLEVTSEVARRPKSIFLSIYPGITYVNYVSDRYDGSNQNIYEVISVRYTGKVIKTSYVKQVDPSLQHVITTLTKRNYKKLRKLIRDA